MCRKAGEGELDLNLALGPFNASFKLKQHDGVVWTSQNTEHQEGSLDTPSLHPTSASVAMGLSELRFLHLFGKQANSMTFKRPSSHAFRAKKTSHAFSH